MIDVTFRDVTNLVATASTGAAATAIAADPDFAILMLRTAATPKHGAHTIDTTAAGATGAAASAGGAVPVADASGPPSIDVSYTVSVSTGLSADDLETLLSTAVTSGTFDTHLHYFANYGGAVVFYHASSSSVTTTTASTDDSSSTPVLSTGGIIGIAIGGFCFVVLVCGGIYYFMAKRSTSVAPA